MQQNKRIDHWIIHVMNMYFHSNFEIVVRKRDELKKIEKGVVHRKSSVLSSSTSSWSMRWTSSFVSRAISNAIGGSLAVNSRSCSGLSISSPSAAVWDRRSEQSARLWTTGPRRSRTAGLISALSMAWSVDATTLPTTIDIALMWLRMDEMCSAPRMLATSAWMVWTSPSVWSSRYSCYVVSNRVYHDEWIEKIPSTPPIHGLADVQRRILPYQ